MTPTPLIHAAALRLAGWTTIDGDRRTYWLDPDGHVAPVNSFWTLDHNLLAAIRERLTDEQLEMMAVFLCEERGLSNELMRCNLDAADVATCFTASLALHFKCTLMAVGVWLPTMEPEYAAMVKMETGKK